MYNHSQEIYDPAFVNSLVAVVLNDLVEQPDRGWDNIRVTEIRQAIAEGKATIDMAVDIVVLSRRDRSA